MKPSPHDAVTNSPELYWNDLRIGDILEFELIDFYNGEIKKKGNSTYAVYLAIPSQDYELLKIRKNCYVTFFIAWRAFEKALQKLPTDMTTPCQRKYAEGKNILIKLEKSGANSIRIHNEEPIEPTAEQLEDSKKIYEMVRKDHDRSSYSNN